jgi:hypothetical protein
LALSILFAWLLSLLTRRIRRKTLLSTVFSLAFLGAYFVFVGQMQNMITRLAQNGTAVAERLSEGSPSSIGSVRRSRTEI